MAEKLKYIEDKIIYFILKIIPMKKSLIAGAIVISAMAFASSKNNTNHQVRYSSCASYTDTVPKKNKKDTTGRMPKDTTWPKRDSLHSQR